MAFDVIIPARYGSTRLPGKPLLDIGGQPMIRRVYDQACASRAERVVIATDDERIAEVARAFGAEVCLTAASHPSGTDRLQEVARRLKLGDERILVNLQGDEPLMPPVLIDQVAGALEAMAEADIATLAEPLKLWQDFVDPNVVKVVTDAEGCALYFSRAAIPWPRDPSAESARRPPPNAMRHLGLYAYRVGLLHAFVDWPPAALEEQESLEQLRALWHGACIRVATAVASVPGGVDTHADLERLRSLCQKGQCQ